MNILDYFIIENMINAKRKGTAFERIVKKMLLGPETEVIRSPASLGSADLISITKSSVFGGSVVLLIQCKYLKKYMSKKETTVLIEDAKRIGAHAWLAYRDKPRGKVRFDQLWPVVTQKISLSKN